MSGDNQHRGLIQFAKLIRRCKMVIKTFSVMPLATKFDLVEHVKESRKAGVTQEAAEVQAQAIERVIDAVTKNKDLATRQDVENSREARFPGICLVCQIMHHCGQVNAVFP